MIETIRCLIDIFKHHGANKFYAKKLAPNDNSKNQFYLGGNFSALNIIPFQDVQTDATNIARSKRDRAKARVDFSWIDEDECYAAPNAQLILYPKYPEVRLSGLLRGCNNAPSKILSNRDEGRTLFLGITLSGQVLGYVTEPQHPLSKAVEKSIGWKEYGVFLEIPDTLGNLDTKIQLLATLTEIYKKQWIESKKLQTDGVAYPYKASNGGGYTLEAELGITPNSYAEPDYLGWEIKQYGVNNFEKYTAKSPITLMTPEPTGGLYRDKGLHTFLDLYGYPDKNGIPDRMNFGGRYDCNRSSHKETRLQLILTGYNRHTHKITDMSGGLALIDEKDNLAAIWHYTKILEHWNKKHSQAAYIPSLFRRPPPEYKDGSQIVLCEKTDLTFFLDALSSGLIYYDPALKIENFSSSQPKSKKRNQLRISHKNLSKLYQHTEIVTLKTNP